MTQSHSSGPNAFPSVEYESHSPQAIQQDILNHLNFELARFPAVATNNDWYLAAAQAIRDRVVRRFLATSESYRLLKSRTVCFLSAEYLPGPHLPLMVLNLDLHDPFCEALQSLGLNCHLVYDMEEEPGLGNGGLGRLAACYMESLATLQIPTIGYGIRYEFGIFDQSIRDGWQVEQTDKWLRLGNPWEFPHPEICHEVKLGGRTEGYHDQQGCYRVRWIPERVVKGVACDTPILGYHVNTVNLLRLWKAEAIESFDFTAFDTGDYYGAVQQKVQSETISKVLYPNDDRLAGKLLRLAQQAFFVSCSLQDMIRILRQCGDPLEKFPEKYAVQLNDTHPALAIPELMRLLVDEHFLDWESAWSITQRSFGYTNHTLLPEALETWPVTLFAQLLPRHLEIIYEINRRFLDEVRLRFPGDQQRLQQLSLFTEGDESRVRMAHLACVGSFSINGVAELHSQLLGSRTLQPFYELWPKKFGNVTNGVSPRRFLALANPDLSELLTEVAGEHWLTELSSLRCLERLADDAAFQQRWRKIKRTNKDRLAQIIRNRTGIIVDPDSLFDVQVKRLHEYKRQHLNVLSVITAYLRLKRNPELETPPRTVLFAGKAAPGYYMAKLMIKLINSVADTINRDPDVADRLRVVFFPDYNVKNGQLIYPAADLSEQISLAGMEASGTGNMKLAMNGALTIGTLDGANIEIREEVGAENFFLFGLTAEEVQAVKSSGYSPDRYYQADTQLREAIDLISSGFFTHGDKQCLRPLVDNLRSRDPFLVLADFAAYDQCQLQVDQVYQQPSVWARMSILNTARMGKFSSDRSIKEYCQNIWKVTPQPIQLG